MRSKPIFTGCGKYLKGVDSSRIHRIRFTLVYKGCGVSLMDVDPRRNHRMRTP